jgi:hypothetical protein
MPPSKAAVGSCVNGLVAYSASRLTNSVRVMRAPEGPPAQNAGDLSVLA